MRRVCELCDEADHYFNDDEAECAPCPDLPITLGIGFAVLGSVTVVVAALVWIVRRPPSCLRWLSFALNRLYAKASSHALVPKLKVLVAVYQVVVAIPSTYNVELPPEYYTWLRVLTWIQFDWDELTIPGSCIRGGFATRILLRGLLPLALMLGVIPLNIGRTCIAHVARRAPGWPAVGRAALDALPAVLVIAFGFCASVSSGLFASWSCVEYEVETPPGASEPLTRRYLRADLTVVCDEDIDENFRTIRLYSWILICVWPLGVPLVFLLLLLPIRYAILQKRNTRLVLATAFIHKEYEPHYYFWEPVFLIERLIVVGFVQMLVEESHALIRIQLGLIITLGYAIVLMFVKPFKRYDADVLAISAQISIVGFFFGALNVKLYEDLDLASDASGSMPELATTITGFTSPFALSLVILAFNSSALVLFIGTHAAPRTLD